MTGGRIILTFPGMLHCKRTKHRIPGPIGRASLPSNLTEYRELGRGPADITEGRLIPNEGSPTVNGLLATCTTWGRPAWATPRYARHVPSPTMTVGRRGRMIQRGAGGVSQLGPDRSTEVSGIPTM